MIDPKTGRKGKTSRVYSANFPGFLTTNQSTLKYFLEGLFSSSHEELKKNPVLEYVIQIFIPYVKTETTSSSSILEA